MWFKWPYRKRLLAVALAALFTAWPLAAWADPGSQLVTQGGTFYTLIPGGSTATVVVKPSPGRLYEIINANTTAQTVTITCYDNAVNASGTVIYAAVLGASQIVNLGIPTTAGIVCAPSAATLAGAGVLILWN